MQKPPDTQSIYDEGPILLFDGVCNLCSAAVQFIIRRDPNNHIRFAALQSDIGQQLLRQHGLPRTERDLTSIVLIDYGKVYTQSDAVLRITRYLTGAWPMLYGFMIMPRKLRNWVYDVIARNRYRWFGHASECMVPTSDIRRRFLGE